MHVATGPVRVETLVGATPMFSRPAYVHPDLRATYDAVGAALEERATRSERPERIFLTRRPGKRSCRNAAEVEADVRRRRLRRSSTRRTTRWPTRSRWSAPPRASAGSPGARCSTSGSRAARSTSSLVSSEAYPCHNEYLMSALLGHRLDIVLCRPDVPRVDGAFTRESFHSDYVYDAEREGAFLASALAQAQ